MSLRDEAEGIQFDPVEQVSYSDKFNAPSWLEAPCELLWNAMQLRLYDDFGRSLAFLRRFWESLASFKAQADATTWPEILAIDAQSQLQGAALLDRMINAMTADASVASSIMGPLGWTGNDAREAIQYAQQLRRDMLTKAEDMANQARTAQAERVAAVAAGRISQQDADAASENRTLEKIIRDNSSLSLGGIPAWAWLLGGVGLVALVRR